MTALSPWRQLVTTASVSPLETGPGRAQDSACHNGPIVSQKPGELAVSAHRTAASPAVSGSLREQTGGGEEERDERKEERTGGGAERGDEGR